MADRADRPSPATAALAPQTSSNMKADLPTAIPPTTDTNDHVTTRRASQPTVATSTHEPSYFTSTPAAATSHIGTEPVEEPDETLRGEEIDFTFPTPKRTKTAPTDAGLSVRPDAPARSSTLLRAMKRTATGGLGQKPVEPYSYTFDAMSSDSASSSGDDDAGDDTAPAVRNPARSGTDNSNAVDSRLGEASKKHARKGRSYSRFAIGNEHMKTKGRISKRDGRLNISINDTSNSGYVAKALGQSLKHHLDIPKHRAGRFKKWGPTTSQDDEDEKQRKQQKGGEDEDEARAQSIAESLRGDASRPRLNIVVMVIGSRGDIQPFLKVGKILKEYGHRVRIASHPTFRDFVEKDVGLEFFSVGGDPSELMAFMVKNPGLVPGLKTIREGEIQRRRTAMGIMFDGFWRACVNSSDDEHDQANLRMLADRQPFVADAIIANPPSMAHVHIAEKLGVPLHMMFTFPYSPTQQFPHPLANIKPGKSNVDANYVNFMSYSLVEMMTWQGLGDIVNRFRERTLALEPVSSLWAPGALYRMHVPYTYLWSPSLVPKPKDWGPEIDIAGFVFLDLASNFTPDPELEAFLNAGEPPIYVGFGSIVVDDPDGFTELIIEATKKAGVRCLLNKGSLAHSSHCSSETYSGFYANAITI
nr:sterol 3-beta-glucosyltransferase ugt80a2 [Quercus suber]